MEMLTRRGIPIPSDGIVLRVEYLNKTAQRQGTPPRLFRDITVITLALASDQAEAFDREHRVQGYERHEVPGAAECRRPGIVLRVVLTKDRGCGYRVVALQFSLKRTPSRSKEYRFGEHSVLTVRPDGTADWTFI